MPSELADAVAMVVASRLSQRRVVGGNLLPHLRLRVQRARQRLALHDRDRVLHGDLPDAEGEVIGAHRHDARRVHGGGVVLDRHRDVLGVGHDHVGLGHGGLQALHGELPRDLHAALLDLRVAFGFLPLVLDLLLGHAQVPLVLEALERVVGDAQHDQHRAHLQRQRQADRPDVLESREHVEAGQHGDLRQHCRRQVPRDPADDDHLEDVHRRLDGALRAEDASEALRRVETLELGLQRLAGHEESDLPEMVKDAEDHRAEHNGGGRDGALHDDRRHVDGDLVGAQRVHVVAAERAGKDRGERTDHGLDARRQDKHAAQQEQRIGRILRAGDVALLAGLAPALGGCVFRSFTEILGHGAPAFLPSAG
jgi:hypothetical protein